MSDLKKLKQIELLENKRFHKEISKFLALQLSIEDLTQRLKGGGLEAEKISKELNEKKDFLSFIKKHISDAYDISLLTLDGKTYPVRTSKPISCFSPPYNYNLNEIYASHLNAENYLYHLMGNKILNDKTKERFIQDNKFLFLKIDLSYDKEDIKFEIDDIVQKAQNLIGKKRPAKGILKQQLFDHVFSDYAAIFPVRKACERTSAYLENVHKITIDADSLYRRYYPEWKRGNRISNIRTWKKQKASSWRDKVGQINN